MEYDQVDEWEWIRWDPTYMFKKKRRETLEGRRCAQVFEKRKKKRKRNAG
jgi:hypothetical protein